MCAANHPFATTTQFSLRRTRFVSSTLISHWCLPRVSIFDFLYFDLRFFIPIFSPFFTISLSFSSQLASYPLEINLTLRNWRLCTVIRINIRTSWYAKNYCFIIFTCICIVLLNWLFFFFIFFYKFFIKFYMINYYLYNKNTCNFSFTCFHKRECIQFLNSYRTMAKVYNIN